MFKGSTKGLNFVKFRKKTAKLKTLSPGPCANLKHHQKKKLYI